MTLRDLWLFAATSGGIALLFAGVILLSARWKARRMKRDTHLPLRLAGTGAIRFETSRKRKRGRA